MDLDKLDLFKGLEDLDLFSETGLKAPSNAKPSQAKAKASPTKGSSQKATPKALPSQRRGRLAQIEYTTAKGQQIKAWVVRQPRPLGDAFQWWLEKARATYGWYKKEHGFLFKSQEAAEQFAKELLAYREQQEEGDRTEGTFEIKEAAKKPKASLSKASTSTTAKATTFEVQQERRGERIERGFEVSTDSPDLWGAKEREAANLAAMRLAATKSPQEMTQEDFVILSQYSGWGGLSMKKYADKFPEGFPIPEERGLIHEYYTPTKIVREVARVIRPYIHQLPKVNEKVVVLEPSAGIGRFVQAASGEGFSSLDWQVVEWSALSARMLQAMRPDLHVFEGPFERWVRASEDKFYGKIGLVLSNPPYGPRGASITEDPNREYREKRAYAYFLRRGLDLLAPEGMGVFLIPSGFMTGQGKPAITLRETILKRHHLSAAYRLPSGIFPGAELVTDLLFFRARGVELTEVHETDKEILEGRYFELYPQHILGIEVGKDGGEDDQTKKPRWGYQVVGEFDRLPELVEREMPKGTYVEAAHYVRSFEAEEALADSLRPKTKPKKKANALVSGVTRSISTDTDGLSQAEALAVQLGARVDRYLAALSSQESDEHVQLWPELSASLQAWVRSYGNPHVHKGLNALIKKDNTAVQRFLSAFTRTGDVIEGIKNKPVWTPRFTGKAGDILAVAEWAYRANKELSLNQIAEAWSQQTRVDQQVALSYLKKTGLAELFKGGWCIDGTHLYPEQDYLSGDLWLKYDALRAKMKDDKNDKALQSQLEFQEQRLLKAINPSVFEDIEDISPRQGWVPLELVTQWINETVTIYGSRQINTLIRKDGIVTLDHEQIDYDNLDDTHLKGSYIYDSIRPILGWINHDMSNFKLKKKKNDDLDEKRLEQAKTWEQSFRSWITASEERKAQIERTYNRLFKGYVEPNYGNEPIQIARWTKGDIKLHPHQSAGARRVLTNRGGMLAFDVGVGKTYTGIAVIARARQEGWCRRPVIVVPNSIAWKWAADIKRVLPDYRVAVIGSKMKRLKVGDKKGQVTSETDTPKDRAEKWTRFQAGEYDVVILTYSALARTRMNEDTLREYADGVEAIKREIKLRQRNAKKRDRGKGDITERQEALLKEGVAAWIAEKMEIPEAWEYDPGIAWDDIGVDMLVVDEAQNFKNLYMPEAREGGVPRFMGNAGEGSNRAWQMDFRCNAVRQKNRRDGDRSTLRNTRKKQPLGVLQLAPDDRSQGLGAYGHLRS
ncbi:SNF2-related protein [Myxococcota bacterium]|nr:SNF2-related protein [Myxococcota bacterium]